MGRSVAQGRPADRRADAGDPADAGHAGGHGRCPLDVHLAVFSNDAAPFALLLVALGMARLGLGRRYGMLLGMCLIVVPLAVNAWGVLWTRALGW